ncbi:MAG: hypothetical protein KJ852_01420 [Gammaproteobacteria bacterium]|jgi:hypothetical protein|nr:hypothetical protein [Gammaproteobacteria bacterium]MBU0788212.1 hypothetical protein [Gammaproteobacteria bacterium]MBU0815291.1 hypothetical protein [Gammaproteobacteria bacterium]MBU1785601.1 hypothetical protein [Gammaproteobacteria bacterium]
MSNTTIALNPFTLMMEPEQVLRIMERSPGLRSLRRHKLRPLDKPLIPYADSALAAYDAEVEASNDIDTTADSRFVRFSLN